MKKYILILGVIIGIGILFLLTAGKPITNNQDYSSGFRYVAVGDSYTIGENVPEQDAWPVLLTNHLNKEGIAINLIANPSVTGWTTQDVIDRALPTYESSNPTFATLLIGVNDWVQGIEKESFHKNLILILDRMQAELPDKSNLILVTIPDFSTTPNGRLYSNGRDISKGISEFNDVIKKEGQKRNLPVVDIYPVSQDMKNNPELVSSDGLHPSAKEYIIWEKLIFPVAFKMLQ